MICSSVPSTCVNDVKQRIQNLRETLPGTVDLSKVSETVAAARAMLDNCENNSSSLCQDALRYANSAVDLAEYAATSCANNTNPTCNKVRTLAVEDVNLVLTTALQCADGEKAICSSAAQKIEDAARSARNIVLNCESGANATCNEIEQTALSEAAAALAEVNNLLANLPTTAQILDRVSNTVDAAIALVDAVVALIPSSDEIISRTNDLAQTVAGLTNSSGGVATPFYLPADATNLPVNGDTAEIGFEVPTPISVDPVLASTSDALLGSALGALPLAVVAPDCDHGYWQFDPQGSATRTWRFPKQNGNEVYNYGNEGGSTTQSLSVSSSRQSSAGITVGGGVEADTGVIIAKVKTTFHVDVSSSIGWSSQITTTMNIPPHKIGHMGRGVYGYAVKGHYYHVNSYCQHDIDKGIITTWSPSYSSWRYWEESV